MTASFAEDGFYESASATQSLRVLPPQIVVLPQANVAPAGGSQAVTAQILDGGVPLSGKPFGFQVLSGPNAGATGVCDPAGCAGDSSGKATFRYTGGSSAGRDTVRAWLDLNHNDAFDAGEAQVTASLHWTVRRPTAIVMASSQGGDYHDPVRLSAVLLNTASTPGAPVAGVLLSFVSEAGSCTARTDGSGTASCFVTPQVAAGSYGLAVDFAGDGRYLPSHAEGPVTVTREETSLAITSPAALERGNVAVRAVLREDGSLPLGGRSVTFHVGGQTFPVTTDAAGVATANLILTGGEHTLEASFAGDLSYEPASDRVDRLLVYERGQFVVWGGNAPDLTTALPLGATYTFWGAHWADQVTAGDFSANSSFKGYADDVFPASGTWRSRLGDASQPPASVPAYLGVILSTHIQKEGDVESGDIAGIGVLRVVDPAAYRPDPGSSATGVLLALLPPDPASGLAGTPPGAPTGVNAVVGDGFAEVEWTPPASTGSGPITGYVVTMSPGGFRFAVPAGETSRVIPGLVFGTAYQFTVSAVSRAGSGLASEPSGAVTLLSVPSVPQAVSAVAANAAATITWSAPAADGGSPVLDYVVESVPGGALVTVGSTVTTATLSGLDNGTSYTFVVRARNAVGLGAESAPSAAVLPASAPSAPAGLVASAASREATLHWTAPAADGGSALTGYRIVTEPGGLLTPVPGNRTFARITDLDDGVAYRFTLVAINAQGDSLPSAPSGEVIPFGLPGAPGEAQATQGNGTALVRWSPPASDGGRPITGYTVTAEPGGLTAAAPAGETSRLITGLTNGTAYTFQITATNLAGTGSASALSAATTPWTVPDEPTGVQATGGDASATVTWAAPATNGGSPISQYVVVSHPDNKQVVVDAGARQATMTGLTNGTFYVFTVRAVSAAGLGLQSLRSNFVQPAGMPNAPTNVQAVVGGLATARVTWTASKNGGSSITTYTVTASPGGKVVTVIGTSTAADVGGLSVGTAYTFTVTATNRIGTGPASQPSNSFVPATVPGAPTNVIAVEEGQNIKVTWTPPHNGFTPIHNYFVLISIYGFDGGRYVSGSTSTLILEKGWFLGTPVAFSVQANNVIGSSPFSAWSNTVTPSNPPGAPGNVRAAVDADAAVRVTWTAAAANGAPITNYTVTSAPGGLTTTVNGTATSAAMSGLTVGTTYTFKVTATNQKGPGPASAPSNPVTVTGTPPTAEIQTPADGAEVTTLTQIIGTARAGSFRDYILEIAPAGDSTFTRIASGTAPVIHGVLGTFDPTMLLNDLYTVRLTVFTTSGASVSTSVSYAVDGNQKIGNFTLSFTDLTVPVSGLPITVIRNYDSRDKKVGDFGIGWTLELRQGSYRNNRKPGLGWEIESGFLPCQQVREKLSHSTVVRLSDTEVYRFRLNLTSPAATIGGCFAEARFDFVDGPVPGAMLTILGDTQVFYQNDTSEVVDTETFDVFEPRQVRLTTRDGRIFDLELRKGVTRLQDLNGNTLMIGSSGITHSSGKSISFVRDGAGRITSITDPMGHVQTYAYDGRGDLVSHTDREGNETRFFYDNRHGLLEIENPLGVNPQRYEYDSDGRLIASVDAEGNRAEVTHDIYAQQEIVRDRRGNQTVVTYDEAGNVISRTDALGNTTSSTYDSAGNKLTETDAFGNTTSYVYDTQRNLLSKTDPLGGTTFYVYNARGQVLSATDPLGHMVTNTYDAACNLLTVTDALGHVTTNTYDARGLLLSTRDALGNITTRQYDSVGNVVRETDTFGREATFTYNANGNELSRTFSRTDESGNPVTMRTSRTYDADSRVLTETHAAGETVTYEYDSVGNRVAVTAPNGTRTEVEYDARGNKVQTTFSDGTSETGTYDEEGNRLTATDRAGRTTRFEYDALNRLIRTILPDGASLRREYDAAGRVSTSIDARGNRTVQVHDAAGRLVEAVDPLGHVTRHTYDAKGNRLTTTDALGRITSFEYDALDRLTRTIFHDGTFTATTYDALGRKTSEMDQAGNTTQFRYDAAGNLIRVTNALGHETTFEYDQAGNRISQTDANGHVTRWAYDNAGRIIRHTLPLRMAATLSYDANGNLLSRTDFNGETTTLVHDANNRLTEKRYPDGSTVLYTYTAGGKPATVTDSRGSTTHSYDDLDRLIRLVEPDGLEISYTYDAAGNRTSMVTPSGVTLYTYDTLNRLASVTEPGGGVTTYTYDAVGNLAGTIHPNGTSTTYTYDALNRLVRLTNLRSDLSEISSYEYTLGPAGNRLQVAEGSGRVVEYTYDLLLRLTREQILDPANGNEDISYTYDPVGNRLTRTSSIGTVASVYDANDRLLSAGPVTFAYDDNGNTLSRIEGSAVTTYSYDAEDRLTEVESPGRSIAYAYDAAGTRVSSSVNGVITRYLSDRNRKHAQVVEERDGAGTLTVRYVHGHDLIGQVRGGTTRYYHYDGLGSVRALTDGVQAVTDKYDFEAFGELVASTGTTPNNYLFAGEQLDPNTGFYYLRARYYDARIGRFTSTDTYPPNLFDPETLHRYVYVTNNPVNLIDPSGQFETTVAGLMTSVTVNQTLSFIRPTLIQGGILLRGVQVFMKPGFALRNLALEMMASNPPSAEAWEEAFRTYQLGHEMIKDGAEFIEKWSERAEILEIGLGVHGFAKALRNVPRTSLSIVEITRIQQFESVAIRIEMQGLTLLAKAARSTSITLVRALTKEFADWSEVIDEGVGLLSDIVLFAESKYYGL